MEIFELWTHVLEEIKIKNPEYYNNFYSFVFPISFPTVFSQPYPPFLI